MNITSEIKQNIQIWINALRSGKYRQDRGYLQTADGFCCLGVACDLFTSKSRRHEGLLVGSYPQYYLPWLNLLMHDFRTRTGKGLTTLNDWEGYGFEEIADLLQAVYIEGALD